jgi:hypothetical protein
METKLRINLKIVAGAAHGKESKMSTPAFEWLAYDGVILEASATKG